MSCTRGRECHQEGLSLGGAALRTPGCWLVCCIGRAAGARSRDAALGQFEVLQDRAVVLSGLKREGDVRTEEEGLMRAVAEGGEITQPLLLSTIPVVAPS